MKNFILVLAILVQSVLLLSQAPQGFNYQAILRNTDGAVKANETVALQISIIDEAGSSTYMEIHNIQTNELGLVNVVIGEGTTSDDLSDVDWTKGPYFIEITVNGILMGTSPLLSVPYALYAKSTSTFAETDPIFSSWDKSSGIVITENQISDFGSYIEAETQSLADVTAIDNSVNAQIKNLVDPTDDQDAATKVYVDVLEQRIFDLEFTLGMDSVVDSDGNYYKFVKIGEQYWMAENLKTTHYSDGSPIPLAEEATVWDALTANGKAFCWYNNDISEGDTYGALYTWAAAMNGASSSDWNPSGVQGVCPDGWHLPSDTEWQELEIYLGMSEGEARNSFRERGTMEGIKLKEAGFAHWDSRNIEANNETGFTALPGGYRGMSDSYNALGFSGIGYAGYFWTATEKDASSFLYRGLFSDESWIERNDSFHRNVGYSVRCVKDSP